MIEFARLWAFALLPLPVLAWHLLPPRPARAAVRLPGSVWQYLSAVSATGRRSMQVMPPGLLLRGIGWIMLVVALSGPFLQGARLLPPTGRDVMLAVDLSASMSERLKAKADVEETTIAAVRRLIDAFLVDRQGDRVGLIGFASEAYLIVPMTFDTSAISQLLGEISIGLPGRRTDLGQAIGLAVRVLRPLPEGERVLIVLSDGQTNAGDVSARDVAELARDAGIVVHAIGMIDGKSDDSESPLRMAAEITGGRYFPADSATALLDAQRAINRLTPVARSDDRLIRDLSWLPLLLALLCLGGIFWQEARDP